MNERIAQPRRRAGWVTGERARDGQRIHVNLALVCCVEQGVPVLRDGRDIPTMWFAYPAADGGDCQAGDRLERTEDLLQQLNDEGLG